MPKFKTCWVLGYDLYRRHTYIRSTQIRDFDKRKMIDTTEKIERAKQFDSKQDALDFLSTCITNEKPYIAQEYRKAVDTTETELVADSDMDEFVFNRKPKHR